MIFDDSLLLGFYAIPFLFALIFPELRSLGVGLGVVIIGALVLVVTGSGGGVGYALGLAFLGLAVMGFVSGAIVRAISFRWAKPSREPLKFCALALVGFLIPPVATAGPSETFKWINRPNVATCQGSIFQVSMAGRILNVPGAPVFSLQDDSEEMPVWFDTGLRSKGFEKFCADYLANPKPLKKMLSIAPSNLGSSAANGWITDHCGNSPSKVDSFICRMRRVSASQGQLDEAVIFDRKFSKTAFKHKIYDLDSMLNEKLLKLDRYPMIDDRLVMECGTYQGSTKMCAAAGILDNGLGFRFRMYTSEATAERNAWAMRQTLNNFANEMTKRTQ